MRSVLLSLVAVTFSFLFTQHTAAQTYYYIDAISVDPAEPTTADNITISLAGQLSSTGATIVSTNYMLMGNIVHISVNAADPGGLSVLVPHTEEVEIGTLPAGSYGILVDGDFILDSAPEFQHSFNVTEAGGPNCADLTIVSVQWATFNDTSIWVHVLNEEVGFDYPAFVLLNAEGDTIARETPNFFAIAAESWHTLEIHPGAELPVGEFTGSLHLWTGFFSEFVCSWDMNIDLCPASECVTVHPYIGNFGGAVVDGSFAWSINDDVGSVANGTFALSGEQQSDEADVCLPPANYTLVVTPLQEPAGGQLVIGMGGEAWGDAVQEPFPQVIPSQPLVFDVVPGCFDGMNGIDTQGMYEDLLEVRWLTGTVELRSLDGKTLGVVDVRDVLGRLVFTTNATNDRIRIELSTFGPYVIQARDRAVKFLAGGN
ncbi:MAG: hypothetical protein JNM62_01760 [Flavobacteriales bacterium]|nr:hypothetical protein [Flavobacteriales bacterium]